MCFGRRGLMIYRIGGLVVSVRACGMSGPSSIPDQCSFYQIYSMYVKHETFRDMRCVGREGGNGAAVGESRIVPRYFSCCQSRTVPMYIAFWQLHSHLYLKKSRVIWDSAQTKNLHLQIKIMQISRKVNSVNITNRETHSTH